MLFRQPGILLLLAILFLATACSFQTKNKNTTATPDQAPAPPPSSAPPDNVTESTTSSTSLSPDRVEPEPLLKDTQHKDTQRETPEESTHADSVNQKPPISPPAPNTGTTAVPVTPVKEIVATAAPTPAKPLPVGRLEGRVQIIGKKNRKHKPSNVIITLKPQNASYDLPVSNRTHEVDMRNKTYTPVAQTILKGDRLQFNNHDDIKHNVFSSSGDNTFDLGTFEGGGVRTVALQHTGIVKVYCNIHPEMATFVMVADNSLHTISNNKGEFVIENIPTGKYALSLWHIRGELNTEVMIETGINSVQELVIDASSYQRVAHKNKFGEEYEKKPALFEDEFY